MRKRRASLLRQFKAVFSRKPVALVDIGGGRKGRAYKLAKKHPEKRFVIVDNDAEALFLQGEHIRNLKKKFSDALSWLKKQRANSKKILNMDFCVMSPESLSRWAAHIPNKIALSGEFLGEVKRVLKKNGRLYITTYTTDVSNVVRILKENGFAVSCRPFQELEKNRRISTTSEEIEIYRRNNDLENVFRIEAVPIRGDSKTRH